MEIEIKKFLKKRNVFQKCINFIKYIKILIINKKLILHNPKKNIGFYDNWNKQVELDIQNNSNWRRGRKEFEELIDFNSFQQIFVSLSKSNDSILEIGSYDGYFIKYYNSFKNIVLSDINYQSNLFPKKKKFNFVKLNGYDLSNFKSNSINVVFSIDTLVRLNKVTLKNYILDLTRIVKKNGYLILHIPNLFHRLSMLMDFTPTSKAFYINLLGNYSSEIIFNDELHQLSSVLICKLDKKE